MIKLYHYNDDKCKEQSHEIYSRDLQNLFGIHLTGYGATKEEAFQDFVNNVELLSMKLEEFKSNLSIDNTVRVDWAGVALDR